MRNPKIKAFQSKRSVEEADPSRIMEPALSGGGPGDGGGTMLEQRIETVEKKVDHLETRFDTVDKRFDSFEANVGDAVKDVKKSVEVIAAKYDERLKTFDVKLDERSKASKTELDAFLKASDSRFQEQLKTMDAKYDGLFKVMDERIKVIDWKFNFLVGMMVTILVAVVIVPIFKPTTAQQTQPSPIVIQVPAQPGSVPALPPTAKPTK